MCGYVHMSAGTQGVQKRATNHPELELQAVISSPIPKAGS